MSTGTSVDAVHEDSAVSTPTPISTLQTPAADSSEAVSHVGQDNPIDPFFFTQFVSLITFPWATTDAPGTLLWSAPIHPDHGNTFVAYLSKLYNAWAGSMDYRFKIAGTGFHGGALAIVRIPPNILPSSINDPTKFNAFEWQLFEVKELGSITKRVMDQRQVMFHYKPYLSTNINSFGGYIAVYVSQQLIASATGTNSVNVEVWHKLSEEFRFAQVKPTTVALNNQKFHDLADSFNNFRILPLFDSLKVTHFHVNPKSDSTLGTYGVNCLSGLPLKSKYVHLGHIVYDKAGHWVNSSFRIVERPLLVTFIGDNDEVLSQHDLSMCPQRSKINLGSENISLSEIRTQKINDHSGYLKFITRNPFSENEVDSCFECFQHLGMIEFLRKTKLNLVPGQGLLFDLHDRETDLPCLTLKMSYDGLLVLPCLKTGFVGKCSDFVFRFREIIRDDFIPLDSKIHARNRALFIGARKLHMSLSESESDLFA